MLSSMQFLKLNHCLLLYDNYTFIDFFYDQACIEIVLPPYFLKFSDFNKHCKLATHINSFTEAASGGLL